MLIKSQELGEPGRVLPPNSVDDFLTRCAFDESFGITNNCHFNSIANSIIQVFVLFPSIINRHRIGTRINWPAGDRDHNQVKEIVPILA